MLLGAAVRTVGDQKETGMGGKWWVTLLDWIRSIS